MTLILHSDWSKNKLSQTNSQTYNFLNTRIAHFLCKLQSWFHLILTTAKFQIEMALMNLVESIQLNRPYSFFQEKGRFYCIPDGIQGF